MRFPQEIADYYLTDMPHLWKETLDAMYRTYMAQYILNDRIRLTAARIMYCYGSVVPSCIIYEAEGYSHGYLSVYLPKEWLALVRPFLESRP